MKRKFRKYIRLNGKSEVDIYLSLLPKKVYEKFVARIITSESLPLMDLIRVNWIKNIVSYKGLYEIRMRFSNRQERIIYFQLIDKQYLMLCGFTKSSTKKQHGYIKRATKLRIEAIRRFKKHGII